MKILKSTWLSVVLGLFVISAALSAQINEFKISASDGAPAEYFGNAVSISGDYAIVGAYSDHDNGINSGSAYIFKRSGNSWVEEAKLLASNGVVDDLFGFSVSISGDYAIVGAYSDGDNGFNSGSAYVFKRSGSSWVEEAILLASDGAQSDGFGTSVSISGDYAIVGAHGNDDDGSGSGSAYVFKRSGSSWVEEAKLLASDGAQSDYFGYSVSISGDYVALGAAGHSENGSVYIFKRSGSSWVEEEILLASDGAANQGFGRSVSISGDYTIVGAAGDDDNGSGSGSAYVFKRSGSSWVEEAKLLASDGAQSDQFGLSVSISGDYAVLAARGLDDNSLVYIFKRIGSSWVEGAKLLASDGSAYDYFGYSVSISGDYVVVGAYQDSDTDNGTNSGSAYLYGPILDYGILSVITDPTQFGAVQVGDTTSTQVGISNIGTDTLNISSLTISGESAQDFSIDTTPFSVAPGDTQLIAINFAPVDTGYYSASLEIESDGGNATVDLTGTATQSGLPKFKLTAIDASDSDAFGNSVSIDGDYAIVGALGEDDNGSAAGAAYIFVRNGSTWVEQAKLVAGDSEPYDNFGYSVSINGNCAVVGSIADDDGGYSSGSVYVFVRNGSTWVEQAKLTASDGESYDNFGYSVSISGNTVLVGAYHDDDGGDDSGSAYVFVYDGQNWTEQTKLTIDAAATLDYFGISVSISGNTAIVGAKGDYSVGSSAGSAHIFERIGTNWVYQTELTASDGQINDWFGSTVALDGNTAIIGSYGIGAYLGGAYLFEREGSTWTEQTKLTASNAHNYNNFGTSVAISGNYAVVGAPHNPFQESDTSSAYIFVREGANWIEQDIVTSNDPIENYAFGRAVAVNGNQSIVGSQSDGSVAPYAGSAYVITGFNPYGTLTASALSLAFGDVFAGESASDTLILRNTGAMVLNIASMDITGNDGTSFSVSTGGSIIVPGDSLLLGVNFSPNHGGDHNATLTVRSDVGSRSIGLSGQGILLVPEPFELIAPLVDEQIQTINPIFRWNASAYPIATDTLFYTLFLDTPEPGVEIYPVGQDTVYTLGFDLIDNTNYFWKVAASVPDGTALENTGGFQSFTVNTSNDLPTAFDLLSPADEEMVSNLQPEFLWEMSSDPDDGALALRGSGKGKYNELTSRGSNSVALITGYDFYLSTDSMLTDVVPVEVIGTSYIPPTELVENQTYYWTVSALDDAGGVTFSDTASFWTNAENEAPMEFGLLFPTPDAMLTDLITTFTWESSSDPDLQDGVAYFLIYGSDLLNMDTVWNGSDTSFTPPTMLQDNSIYYWSVLAADEGGLVTFNTNGYGSFVVNQGNDDPATVELVTPDSVMVLSLTPEMYWTAATDIDPGDQVSYEMHWWGTGIEYDSVVTDTNAVELPRELADNTQYFWQVLTLDLFGGISQSEDATFWVDLIPEAPAMFALTYPEDNVTGLAPTLSFTWEPAIDPDPMDYANYTLQIATDSNFTDITHEGLVDINLSYDLTEELPTDTEFWWRVIAMDTDSLSTESEVFKFTVGTVSIASVALPTQYVLQQNYPNPFNPTTKIKYGLPEAASVSLVIYDIRGNVVKTIDSGHQPSGWYEHVWQGLNAAGQPVSTGLYFSRLTAGSYSKVIKMLYLK